MKFSSLLKLYFVSLLVFLITDFIWIGGIASSFYQNQIGFLLSPKPNMAAAVIFYSIYIAGLLYFVVLPSLKVKKLSTLRVLLIGGLFGFVSYAVYDLTNYITLSDWPLLLTVVDMLWGSFVTGLTAAIGYKFARRFL